MMSADDPAVAQRLAAALAEIIGHRAAQGERALLVASSDLHHIENYDQVVRRDRQIVDAVAAFDLDRLTPLLLAPGCSVCGRMPILTLLRATKLLGADAVEILHQTNSGDVTGQRRSGGYTVGYMAAAVYRSQRDRAAL
jgi:AmmeMemoRadiSam system protein B